MCTSLSSVDCFISDSNIFPFFFIQVYGFTLFTQELAFLRILIGLMEKEGKARPN
jgi:hypothetical protein